MDGMMELYITESSSNTSSALRSQMNALGGRGNDGNLSVLRCRRVHQLLEKKDNELYNHIAKIHQVEPQLYVLRWLRLVFTREFHIDDVMVIWDAVLADSSSMRLVDYIAVSMLLYVKANVLEMDDTCAVMSRLMKYPPVENIGVIIQNALAVSDNAPKKPSMSYGHLPRPPQPAPAADETSPDPLAAIADTGNKIAATVVQSTRDLFDLPDPQVTSTQNTTGFTPRPDMPTGFTPRPQAPRDPAQQKAAASLFESPSGSPTSSFRSAAMDSPKADAFAQAGDITHRKVTASFGPGASGASSGPLPAVTESPVIESPVEVAMPVDPQEARAGMVGLVQRQEASVDVVALLDGALNWKDELARDRDRKIAEQIDKSVCSFGKYIADTQQMAEQNPDVHAALAQATEAMSQLEVLKSCLILGGDIEPSAQCTKQMNL